MGPSTKRWSLLPLKAKRLKIKRDRKQKPIVLREKPEAVFNIIIKYFICTQSLRTEPLARCFVNIKKFGVFL